jgi:hypothetical protein
MTGQPSVRFASSSLQDVRPADLLIRFAFGAGVSAVAAVLGIVVGVRFGGVFLAFPAILPATLTLIEEEESTRRTIDDDLGAVLGATALVLFAVLAWRLIPPLGAAWALSTASVGWLGLAVLLFLVVRWFVGRH